MTILYKTDCIKQLMLRGEVNYLTTLRQRKEFARLISLFCSIANASNNIETMKCFQSLCIKMNGDTGNSTLTGRSLCIEITFRQSECESQIEINTLDIKIYGKEKESNRSNTDVYAAGLYSKTGA